MGVAKTKAGRAARAQESGLPEEDARLPRGVVAAVLLLGAWLWGSTVPFQFTLDDPGIAYRNSQVERNDWKAMLGSPLRAGSTAEEELGVEDFLYRPLPKITFAWNRLVSGERPWSYHAANVLLHAAAAALVLALLRRLGFPPPVPALAATFFLLHPVHVETVANVKHREEILAALGVLAAWLFAVRAREARSGGAAVSWAAAASGAFFLALLSKESAIAAVVLIPLACSAFPGKEGSRADRRAPAVVALLVAAAAWLALRASVVGLAVTPGTEVFFVPGEGLWTRLLTSAKVWAAYYVGRGAILHSYPIGFSSRCEVPVESGIPSLAAAAGLALLCISLAAAAVAWRRGARRWAFWVFFFWIALLPTSNLLVRIGTVGAFRLLYLPSLAWGVLLGGAALAAASRVPPAFRRTFHALAVLIPALAWTGISLAEIRNWRDDAALNASDLRRTSNPRARFAEAMAEADSPAREEWLREVARIMEAAPGSARGMEVSLLTHTYTELGELALRRGAAGEADALAGKALAVLAADPRFRRYEVFPLTVRAEAARARGDTRAEMEAWERCVAADPFYPRPYLEMARILEGREERERAAATLEQGIAAIASSGFAELLPDRRRLERALAGVRRRVSP